MQNHSSNISSTLTSSSDRPGHPEPPVSGIYSEDKLHDGNYTKQDRPDDVTGIVWDIPKHGTRDI